MAEVGSFAPDKEDVVEERLLCRVEVLCLLIIDPLLPVLDVAFGRVETTPLASLPDRWLASSIGVLIIFSNPFGARTGEC